MIAPDKDAHELLALAAEAFPWFDQARLGAFVQAVQETAYRASRIANASRPAELLDPECEYTLAVGILEFVVDKVRDVTRD